MVLCKKIVLRAVPMGTGPVIIPWVVGYQGTSMKTSGENERVRSNPFHHVSCLRLYGALRGTILVREVTVEVYIVCVVASNDTGFITWRSKNSSILFLGLFILLYHSINQSRTNVS